MTLYSPIDRVGEEWRADALCAQTDPEAFFPERGQPTGPAKRICFGCSVRAECLEYALDNDEQHGIWGGMSERERLRIVQARRRTEVAALVDRVVNAGDVACAEAA